MTSETDDLRLAADFAPASYDDWRKLVDGVLKGAPFEKLVGKTYDGLKIDPIYRRAQGATPVAGRPAAAPWRIMQRIDHPDATVANAQALHDMENGTTGLEIEFADGPGARGFGVADLVESRGFDPAKVDIRFDYQPLSTMAVRGAAAAPWPEMEQPFAKMIGDLMGRGFKGPFALADGRPVHDAGGSEAQELAFALAVAVAYLRAMETGGMALDAARTAVSFRLSADADQFLTMAKFSAGLGGANAITVLPHTLALGLPDPFARRAARNTQLVLLEESNLAKVSDPAAGSGGTESLTQQLCEAAWSLFQEIETAGGVFASLEQNLIQRKVAATRTVREANIARRKEVLTGASEFPNLHEAQVAVLEAKPVALVPYGEAKFKFDALPPMRLAAPFESLRDRSDQILKDKGARPKVFLANLGAPADFTARATFAKSFFETGGIEAVEFLPPPREASSPSPLPSGERSTPQASGEGALRSDNNPSPAPSPSAQERPLPTGEVKDFAALAAAFKASGTALACLCSSDKVYGDLAADAAKALQAAGAKHIYLAGRPGDQEAALRAGGVSHFIFAGGDALATLQQAYRLAEGA